MGWELGVGTPGWKLEGGVPDSVIRYPTSVQTTLYPALSAVKPLGEGVDGEAKAMNPLEFHYSTFWRWCLNWILKLMAN